MSDRMYVGNAKTYFQPLGKSESSSGYLMSPFGDDRWDLDDQEKLGKVYRKVEKSVRESKSKSENVSVQQVHPVQCSSSAILHQTQTGQTDVQAGLPNQACGGHLDALRREKMFGPGHVLDKGGALRALRTMPTMPTLSTLPDRRVLGINSPPADQQQYQRTRQPLRIHETYDLLPSEKSAELCGSCQEKSKFNDNYLSSGAWKSSPDVPVLIAGGTSYMPMGPQAATPNPFFPPHQRNFYSPLR